MTLHTPIHVRQPDTPTHPPARLTVTSELKSGGTQQSGLLPHRNLSPASSEKRQAEGNAGPTLNRRATGKITGAFSPHFCQEQKDLAKGKPTGGCTPCSPGWVGASPRWGPRRLPTPESARFQHIHPPTRQDPGPGNPRRVLSLHRARESQRRQGEHGEGTEQHEGHEGARGYMEVHRGAQGEDTGYKQEHSGAWGCTGSKGAQRRTGKHRGHGRHKGHESGGTATRPGPRRKDHMEIQVLPGGKHRPALRTCSGCGSVQEHEGPAKGAGHGCV